MRCACHSCGAYMAHSESLTLGCVCPGCGRRCTDCLGTGTLLSREELSRLAADPAFEQKFGAAAFHLPPAGEEIPDDYPEEDPYGD